MAVVCSLVYMSSEVVVTVDGNLVYFVILTVWDVLAGCFTCVLQSERMKP